MNEAVVAKTAKKNQAPSFVLCYAITIHVRKQPRKKKIKKQNINRQKSED